MYFCQALLGRRNDKPKDRYSRLDQEIENSNQAFIMDQQQQQEVTDNVIFKNLKLAFSVLGNIVNVSLPSFIEVFRTKAIECCREEKNF